MAKKVTANLKMRIPAGRASAGPPVGSTLGQYGLNMMDFVNPFNEQTKDMQGVDVIVHLKIYDDRSFDFTVIGEPVDDMIRKAVGIQKGSAKSHIEKVGKLTDAQLTDIATKKLDFLNVNGNIDAAKKIIAGTARSMGVETT
jgi:large subunit ribosomal protein L11